MKTKLVFTAAVLAMAAAGAQARDIYWSIGINAPIQPGVTVGTVISNAPAYRPAPVYYEPAPAYYEPAPAYYEPARIYYPAAPVFYAEPIYYRPAQVFERPARVVVLPQPYYAPRQVVYAQGWAPSYRGRKHGPKHGEWRDHGSRGEPVMVRSRER